MTRDEARDLFSAAWDGELGEARAAFDAQLANDSELRAEYDDFTRVLRETQAMMRGADPLVNHEAPVPDVLAGVQRKLRTRSGGRFYRDRFSERSGRGVTLPLLLAAAMFLLLAAAFLAIEWTSVVDAPPSTERESTAATPTQR
jgi:hypothetical protein